MIENDPTNLVAAFEMLLEEIEAARSRRARGRGLRGPVLMLDWPIDHRMRQDGGAEE